MCFESYLVFLCISCLVLFAQGNLKADENKFPNGIRALASYAHKRGLKFGIYGDAG